MKRIFSLFILFWIILQGCTPANQQEKRFQNNSGKVRVLSTIAMIHELVKAIGGDHVDSIVLIPGELDPHSYQLVKGDDEKLSSAQIIFYNGLELEHGPSLKQYLHKSPKAVPLGNQIFNQNPSLILHDHNQLDPHIWMDISLWAKTIPFITEKLVEADPQNAQDYQKKGEELQKNLLQVHEQVRQKLMQIPSSKRFLVTSHDAFNYFARAYLADESEIESQAWRRRFEAPEGLAPDSQLSVSDIQNVIEHLNKYQIHVIFPESNVSKDSIRKIVYAGKEKGLDLQIAQTPLYGDAMGPPGSDGDTYTKMIQHNAQTISRYLQSNHAAAKPLPNS